MKHFLLVIIFAYSCWTYSQDKSNKSIAGNSTGRTYTDSIKTKREKTIATIDMYLQFNAEIDSSIVDTTISIKKDYKFN